MVNYVCFLNCIYFKGLRQKGVHLPVFQGYAWCRRHHVGWYSIRKPAAGGNFFELYHHKDGMGITFFDDGNAMGWET